MLLRNAWYIGAWADEFGDKPVARRICGDPVVLFRDSSGKLQRLWTAAVTARHRSISAIWSRPVSSAAITVSFSTPADRRR